MGRGMIPGPIWKMPCYNLFMTYLTMTERNLKINEEFIFLFIKKQQNKQRQQKVNNIIHHFYHSY